MIIGSEAVTERRKDVCSVHKWMVIVAAIATLAAAVWHLWRGERDLRRPFVEDFETE